MTFVHDAADTLKLGFLSPHNPYDRRAFSGTPFFAVGALKARAQIDLRVLGHAPLTAFDRLLRRKSPALDIDQLDFSGLDAVVGLVATPLLEQLSERHDLPFLHVTDATPQFLRDSYGWQVADEACAREKRVAARAAKTVYSANMMAERAPNDLDLPRLAPEVVPFGVNIEELPTQCPITPLGARIELLFIGLDWVRKGGDIAVAALDQLLAQGQDAHLTIVGCCPEKHRSHPAITYAGYINKNRPKDALKMNRLLTQAHLLLLPSRGDCTPMVVAEAMAHGTPVVAADTGGIAAQINGVGVGRVLPQFTDPAGWASVICDLTADGDAYAMMADAAFERAQHGLSWSAWAAGIEHTTRQALWPTQKPQVSAA